MLTGISGAREDSLYQHKRKCVHTNTISSISKFPTVFVVADGLGVSFEGRPDDIADGLMGDVPAYPDCLPALGDLAIANSHGIERFMQPKQAGFSSSHCHAMFSKGSKAGKSLAKSAATFIFLRLHSKHPPRDFVCVLRIWGGIISTIGRVSPTQSARLEFDNKKCDDDEGIRPTDGMLVSVSRISYSVFRIAYYVVRIGY